MSLSSTNAVVGLHGVERSRPAIPDPQALPKAGKAKRRKFSASDKRRILAAVDQATEPGEIGRILRREGSIIRNSASGASNAPPASSSV